MEAVYSVLIRKQNELIRMQQEISALKEMIRYHEIVKTAKTRPRPQQPSRFGVSDFIAVVICSLLVEVMIGLAIITHS